MTMTTNEMHGKGLNAFKALDRLRNATEEEAMRIASSLVALGEFGAGGIGYLTALSRAVHLDLRVDQLKRCNLNPSKCEEIRDKYFELALVLEQLYFLYKA